VDVVDVVDVVGVVVVVVRLGMGVCASCACACAGACVSGRVISMGSFLGCTIAPQVLLQASAADDVELDIPFRLGATGCQP
jgi:hypothetical protein